MACCQAFWFTGTGCTLLQKFIVRLNFSKKWDTTSTFLESLIRSSWTILVGGGQCLLARMHVPLQQGSVYVSAKNIVRNINVEYRCWRVRIAWYICQGVPLSQPFLLLKEKDHADERSSRTERPLHLPLLGVPLHHVGGREVTSNIKRKKGRKPLVFERSHCEEWFNEIGLAGRADVGRVSFWGISGQETKKGWGAEKHTLSTQGVKFYFHSLGFTHSCWDWGIIVRGLGFSWP